MSVFPDEVGRAQEIYINKTTAISGFVATSSVG